MELVRHLTGPELSWLAEDDPPRAGHDDAGGTDGGARAHLAGCAVCGARLDALRQQEAALAAALVEDAPESPAEAARVDALADRMMARLRTEVNAGAAAPAAAAFDSPPIDLAAARAARE